MPQDVATREATEPFGVLLRRLRERSGLSQQELADRADLTPHAISALERGTRTRPYPHTVRSLAEALELSDLERARLIDAVPRRRAGQSRPGTDGGVHHDAVQPDDTDAPTRFVVPPTPLHGREHDVADLLGILGRERLITLTGPGGVGKTRLAAAVSDALAGLYPDGIVRVSLASLTSASSVMSAIRRALGVAGSDGPEAYDTVAAHLRPMTLLLVLDNFEHLLSAAPEVGRLVAECPRLTVLTTSRSPLRVRAEHEYAVQPLDLPEATADTVEQLALSPAGALVLDRVRSLSSLWLATDDVRALTELCHRLAGIPLALELATARVRLLGPRALLDRLDEATASSSARDLPMRQRTMRATLDWSFGLLDEQEQRLFTLLGVFRGGADLVAIEDVAEACSAFERGQVLDLVAQLVEHSLVTVRPGPDGRHRFTMLEPVAQYARSLVVGDAAAAQVRAHAQVYLRFAEQAAAGYEHQDQVAWLARTEVEEANLLVAIERSLDIGDNRTAGRITWYLWLYWWLRGQMTLGRRLAEACLATDLEPAERGRVHLTAATMSFAGGDPAAAAFHWAEADRHGVEQGDAEIIAKGRAGTALAAMTDGDLSLAEERFRDSLTYCEASGTSARWIASLVHVWLGTVLLLRSEPEQAVTSIERALDIARGAGDRLCTYVALYNLAQARIALGDYAEARRHVEEGIALSEQTRDLANLAYLLETLAVVESRDGRAERVAALLGAAAGLREVVGANVYAYYLPDETLGQDAERSARAALGDDAYEDALDAGRALDLTGVIELALGGG